MLACERPESFPSDVTGKYLLRMLEKFVSKAAADGSTGGIASGLR
jgi:hypothetical protein